VVAGSLALAALVSGVLLPSAGAPVNAVPDDFVTGWVPHWRAGEGVKTIERAGTSMAEVSPFWFRALPDGRVGLIDGNSNTSLGNVVRAARDRQMLVLPSIVDGNGALVLANLFADPAQRAAHIAHIVHLVVNGNGHGPYDGIDIDYENFAFTDPSSSRATTQPLWISFVKELGAALHDEDKLLSITVPPIWNDGGSGYWFYGPCSQADTRLRSDGTPTPSCAAAWADLMPFVDRWRLMVYDWSPGRAGPQAPMYWLDEVIAYVKATVPSAQQYKVQLGVPAYGRNWATKASAACTGDALRTVSVLSRDAPGLAAQYGVPIVDATSLTGRPVVEKTFVYTRSYGIDGGSAAPPKYEPPPNRIDEVPGAADPSTLRPATRLGACIVERTVYFPDTASILARVDRIQQAGLGGAVIWALSFEPADLWTS
jgi:spore germination protein YaaH